MRFLSELKWQLVAGLLVYGLLKLAFSMEFVNEYVQQVTLLSFIVVLTALGLNVIYGYTGQFSLGHAAFYGLGAYCSGWLCRALAVEDALPFIPVMLASGLFSAGIGCLIGIPILRLKDDFLAIATLGFGVLIRVFLDNSDKLIEELGGSRGFIGIPKITNMETVFFTTLFLILITRNLISSRYGLFWRCIKSDELASSSIGIDTSRQKLLAFVYGCFLAGVGGALYAHLYTFLHPSNFDLLKSIDFLIIVIVGGMGSIVGTILAGFLWVGIIEGLRIVLPSEYLELRWVFIPLMLIAIMIWRPHGLMARKERG